MTDPLPIRDGIIPGFDTEREMLDYCQKELRFFREEVGVPATRIAIVLIGENEEGLQNTRCNSWDSIEKHSRFETCAFASTLFLQRALAEENL